MQARSLVGTAARLEAYADATLALPVVTSRTAEEHGWAFVFALRELGEQLRASAPVPYEPGQDRAVDESVAALLGELDADSMLAAEALEEHGAARRRRRVVTVGDRAVVPLSRTSPGVHNWPVVLDALDRRLETVDEKLQRVEARLHRAQDAAPYEGIWTTALEMLAATRTATGHLWRRQRTIAHRLDGFDGAEDGPRRFGRWALEHMEDTDGA